jgi:hypothetical protein
MNVRRSWIMQNSAIDTSKSGEEDAAMAAGRIKRLCQSNEAIIIFLI